MSPWMGFLAAWWRRAASKVLAPSLAPVITLAAEYQAAVALAAEYQATVAMAGGW